MLKHDKSWHDSRSTGIGGSDAKIIASGGLKGIQKLWRLKTGRQEDDDLDGILPAMMPSWTEPLNRAWIEKKGFDVIDSQPETFVSALFPFMRANLDGIVEKEGKKYALECKHFDALTDHVKENYAQLQHNTYVSGYQDIVLSVLISNKRHVFYEVKADHFYQTDLIGRSAEFWKYVESDKMPETWFKRMKI